MRGLLLSGIIAACAVSASPAIAQHTPADGRIQSFYFDAGDYTEVWVDFTPPPRADDRISAITLNITVRHPGKPLEGPLDRPPLAVIVRAAANDLYKPAFIRQPTMDMRADGEAVWDRALPVNFHAAGGTLCDGCSLTANRVEVKIPIDALSQLGSAQQITGNAMGFDFELSPGQIALIRELSDRLFGRRPP